MKASDVQVGGSHYKDMPIQPAHFNTVNRLGFLEGNVVKRVCRHRQKGGAEDIRKAIHELELILEYEYGETPKVWRLTERPAASANYLVAGHRSPGAVACDGTHGGAPCDDPGCHIWGWVLETADREPEQPQGCDGDHSRPECPDPECWLKAPEHAPAPESDVS